MDCYLIILLVSLLAICYAHEQVPAIPGNGSSVLVNGKYEIQSEGIRALFVPYGASLSNLFIQDVHGTELDIVLGFDNASHYSESALHPHLNGVPGRYANRIRNGTFTIDGKTYHTDLNDNGGLDTLHGGADGWDWRNWTVAAHTTDSITFSLIDPPGKEGFPGQVVSYVTYTLTPHQWHIRMTALSTTKKTPIMLSSHTYLNLDGFKNPRTDLALDHSLYMPYAGKRIAIDNIEVPTGEILTNEEGGVFDFWSVPKRIGEHISSPGLLGACGINCTGYDTCFIFNKDDANGAGHDWRDTPVATLSSPCSGIQLNIHTNQDAMQLYTCNNMNGKFSQTVWLSLLTNSRHIPAEGNSRLFQRSISSACCREVRLCGSRSRGLDRWYQSSGMGTR
jgi:aldose 1-epimerase